MTDTRTRRPTRQRTAIEADVDRSDEFRSAQEVHASLAAGGDKIGLATVYRTLQAMVDEEALDSLRTDDGEIVYRRCSTGHHHHLVCRDCGRTVEVEGPAVERWADKVSAEHGFTDVSHTLELFGRCVDCG
ncbi:MULTISPECIES: Fur family transcriptional regulator [Janibacter]|uniref:Fur family transcriptional regulator, ferric uptake regulator n=1 Tax=Janibacter indicus TaxID=857417 RepID=A0A1W2B4E7_9MICO|nr:MULTISPECIES: transcriptional repressor [Janibacter]QNF93071.1 transcriptional repressor [Janibacter sp. YB324]SMC67873.1 Fur family transcriptional regulator, ferric uptake regulator [Janibacter indicus]